MIPLTKRVFNRHPRLSLFPAARKFYMALRCASHSVESRTKKRWRAPFITCTQHQPIAKASSSKRLGKQAASARLRRSAEFLNCRLPNVMLQKASEGIMFERCSGDQPGEGLDSTRVVPADQKTFLKEEQRFSILMPHHWPYLGGLNL